MSTYYEWDIEEVDEYEDIQDHDFQDKLKDFGAAPNIDGKQRQLVLVRNVIDRDGDLVQRDWAYAVKHDKSWLLPELFENRAKVPNRFQVELKLANF